MQEEFDLKIPRLDDLDGAKTQKSIEAVFEKYRFYKSITFEEREATTTASYEDRPSGPTNVISDQTANVAIFNVDEPERRRVFMHKIERAVSKLPGQERLLISKRYMEDDYKRDYQIYDTEMPMSKTKYTNLRLRAFYRLAFTLSDFRIINIQSLVKNIEDKQL
ncbi:ArpU family phage packaging/lysis transcriptional regulator [Paenibacillus ihumii]|uniref:ArpU family phage packaging/lysis transcriptional regulator n=1 Tax=Paenibacillus ihumii TaxID=687436 RepID=UPI0006D83133|nr:ArpU family phage packaging/lysis transcriptional regulator [Paenibacillus ihumii]